MFDFYEILFRQQIKEALNQQTAIQFRQYAKQQAPDNPEQVCISPLSKHSNPDNQALSDCLNTRIFPYILKEKLHAFSFQVHIDVCTCNKAAFARTSHSRVTGTLITLSGMSIQGFRTEILSHVDVMIRCRSSRGSNCEKWTGRVSSTAGSKGMGGHNGMNRETGGLNPQPPINSNPGSSTGYVNKFLKDLCEVWINLYILKDNG